MKDFTLRNDTRLLMRNDPVADLTELTKGKRVLFVYGGGSVKRNGCYDDIKKATQLGGATLFELGGASREMEDIERGTRKVKEHDIQLVIGAGQQHYFRRTFYCSGFLLGRHPYIRKEGEIRNRKALFGQI